MKEQEARSLRMLFFFGQVLEKVYSFFIDFCSMCVIVVIEQT